MATLEELALMYAGNEPEEEEDPLLTLGLTRGIAPLVTPANALIVRRPPLTIEPRINTDKLHRMLQDNIEAAKERKQLAEQESVIIEGSPSPIEGLRQGPGPRAFIPKPVSPTGPTIPIVPRPTSVPLSMQESGVPIPAPTSPAPVEPIPIEPTPVRRAPDSSSLLPRRESTLDRIFSSIARQREEEVAGFAGGVEGVAEAATVLGLGALGFGFVGAETFRQAMEGISKNLDPMSKVNFARMKDAFFTPMKWAYQSRSPGGQLVSSLITSPFEIINAGGKFLADQARKLGISEDNAIGLELALNLVGIGEIMTAGRGTRLAISKLRSAIKTKGLASPETIKAAAELRNIMSETWVATQDFPTLESYEQFLKSRRERQTSPATESGLTAEETASLNTRQKAAIELARQRQAEVSQQAKISQQPEVTASTPVETPTGPVEEIDVGVFSAKEPTPTPDRSRTGIRRTGRKVADVPATETERSISEAAAQLQRALENEAKTEVEPRPPKVDLPNVPDYVVEEIDRRVAELERLGVLDDVIRESMRGKTTAEVFREISDRLPEEVKTSEIRQLIRGARTRYGIASADELAEVMNMEGNPPSAATTPGEPVTETPLEITRNRLNDPTTRKRAIADLKGLLREGKTGRMNYEPGLREFGFSPDEIAALLPELKATKATRLAEVIKTEQAQERAIKAVTTDDKEKAIIDPNYKDVLRVMSRDPEASVAQIAGELGLSVQAVEPLRNVILSDVSGETTPVARETIVKKPTPRRKRKGESATPAPTEPTQVETAQTPVAPRVLKFHPVSTVTNLENALDAKRFRGEHTAPSDVDTPISIGYEGSTAEGVYVNTVGLDVTESAADINAQMEAGTLTLDQGKRKLAVLSNKARAAGVPLSEAHLVNFDDIPNRALEIAKERGLNVYVRTGTTFDKIDPDAVTAASKLDDGDGSTPSGVSLEEAAAYLEERLRPPSEDIINIMEWGLENGVDVSDQIPSRLAEHFRRIFNEGRRTIEGSEHAEFMEILSDLSTVQDAARQYDSVETRLRSMAEPTPEELSRIESTIDFEDNPPTGPLTGEAGAVRLGSRSGFLFNQRGSIGRYGFDLPQRLAIQRLDATAKANKKPLEDYLRRIPGVSNSFITVVNAYLKTLKNPAPPSPVRPSDMRLEPGFGTAPHRRTVRQQQAAATFLEEENMMWKAAQINPPSSKTLLLSAIMDQEHAHFKLPKYGLMPIEYAARAATRTHEFYRREMRREVESLRKVLTPQERRNIMAYNLNLTQEGRRINKKNGITPPSALTDNEARASEILHRMLDETFKQIQEGREATGRLPLKYIDNYITHARKFTVAEEWGMRPSLITDPRAKVTNSLHKHSTAGFPYVKRKGAAFRAEYDVLNVTERYLEAAIRDIHMSPISAKIQELITKRLRDPKGNLTYSVKTKNPELWAYLNAYKQKILGIPNFSLESVLGTQTGRLASKGLSHVTRNIGLSSISYAVGSVLNQLGSVPNIIQEIGTLDTVRGLAEFVKNPINAIKVANKESQVIDSRSFDILANRAEFMFRDWRIKNPVEVANRYGTFMLTNADKFMAIVAWHGAYNKYLKATKDSYKAARLADDVLVRSQGNTMPGGITNFQNSVPGGAISVLQNFAFNNFYQFLNTTLGVDQGRSTIRNGWNLTKWIMATSIMGLVYRALGQQSPGFSPITTVASSIQEGDDLFHIAGDLALDFVSSQIPIAGGAMKYSKSLFGPIGETAIEAGREPIAASLRYGLGIPRSFIELGQTGDPYASFFRSRNREEERRRVRRVQRVRER